METKSRFDVILPPYNVMEVSLRSDQQVVDWSHAYGKYADVYGRTRGAGAAIFILDTAGEFTHPDLAPNALNALGKNFSGAPTLADLHGHGTHCAGIAAAVDNDFGVIGVAPAAKLVPVKVLNDQGAGSWTSVAQGIRYAADVALPAGIKHRVISMSLGGASGSPELEQAVNYAIGKGCFVVAAAGNSGFQEGQNTIGYPGRYEQCITVASIGRNAQPSAFSSAGPEVDIAAGGEGVYSTHKNNTYAYLSGTSMATPGIAGLVALLVTAFNFQNNAQLEAHLETYATDIHTPGEDVRTGAGAGIAPKLFSQQPQDPPPPPPPAPSVKYLFEIGYDVNFAHRVHTDEENSIHRRVHGHTAHIEVIVEVSSPVPSDRLYASVENWVKIRLNHVQNFLLVGQSDFDLINKSIPGARIIPFPVADMVSIATYLRDLVNANFKVVSLKMSTGQESVII